jgi:hypothetical protein
LQRRQRFQPVLRRSDINQILDAAGCVEPVAWLDLAAARQAEQDRPGHRAFGQSDFGSFCSIDGELDSLQIIWLLNPNVNRPANTTNLIGQVSSHFMIGRQVAASNLNIVRRRKPEVDRLGGNVGRQEIEDNARKLLVKAKS